MLRRLFAVLTTAVLALGLSLGAPAPASANPETCNSRTSCSPSPRSRGAQFKVSIPQTSVDSGILAFEYSSGWTGSCTVEWVQFNSSYFNQDRDSAKFLNCQKDKATPVAPIATPITACGTDGSLTYGPTPTDCANPTALSITQAVCDTATGTVTSGSITVPSIRASTTGSARCC